MKRIALSAAAAVTISLAVVAPAFAAATVGNLYFGNPGTNTTSTSVAVGVATAIPLTAAFNSDAVSGANNATLTPVLTDPSNTVSLATVGSAYLNYTLSAGTNVAGTAPFGQVANGTTGAIVISAAATSTPTLVTPVIDFTPPVAGIYVLTYTMTGPSVVGGGSLVASLTIFAGYSADSVRPNTVFVAQGTNAATEFSAVAGGGATARFTNFPPGAASVWTHYFVTVTGGTMVSAVSRPSSTVHFVTTSGGTTGGYNLTNGQNLSGGVDFWANASTIPADIFDVQVTSPVAGRVTITVATWDPQTGFPTIFSQPVVTFFTLGAFGSDTIYMKATNLSTAEVLASDNVTNPIVANTTNVQQSQITVTMLNPSGSPAIGVPLSVAVSGPGLIKAGIAYNDTSIQSSFSRIASTLALPGATLDVFVYGDGTSGTGTITISSGAAILATKTVTFYGPVASLTAVAAANVVSTAGAASNTQYAIQVTAKDAGGVPVRGIASSLVGAVGNDLSIVSGLGCIAADDNISSPTYKPGVYDCRPTALVSGKTGVVSLKVANNNVLVPIVSNPVSFTVGTATIASLSIAFDKATYAPSEKAILTFTALDAAGNPVADDGIYTALHTLSFNVVSPSIPSVPFAGASGAFNSMAGAGLQQMIVYVPAIGGTFIVTNLLGSTGITSTLAKTTIPTSAKVVADTSATDATTAQIQQGLASVQILSTTISSMITSLNIQLNAISAFVAKIMKKLGIK